MNLTIHPAANLFPLMEGVPFESLCDDIRVNGQREPIMLKDGMIIDGRNRDRACRKLGIVPITEEWQGEGSVVDYVCSANLHRRDLSPTQKACVAVLLLPMMEADAKARMKRGTKVTSGVRGTSRDIAARAIGSVSGKYVSMAKRLLKESPRAFQRCFMGQEPLTRAICQVRRGAKRRLLKRKLDELHGKYGDYCFVQVSSAHRQGGSRTFCFRGKSVDDVIQHFNLKEETF